MSKTGNSKTPWGLTEKAKNALRSFSSTLSGKPREESQVEKERQLENERQERERQLERERQMERDRQEKERKMEKERQVQTKTRTGHNPTRTT